MKISTKIRPDFKQKHAKTQPSWGGSPKCGGLDQIPILDHVVPNSMANHHLDLLCPFYPPVGNPNRCIIHIYPLEKPQWYSLLSPRHRQPMQHEQRCRDARGAVQHLKMTNKNWEKTGSLLGRQSEMAVLGMMTLRNHQN